ncbi:hypothetical protein [Bradyrhizobium sp. BR13661]|uniref:hypothetical protein n=1 Tax=Bradyrhizobium sp. BR13661 TaxID=2940622 RepID=UPI002474BB13|nr:hypothetical protein [Bradyrhizobium sp. BR13661]
MKQAANRGGLGLQRFLMLTAPGLLGGEARLDRVEDGELCLFDRRYGVIDRETGVFFEKLRTVRARRCSARSGGNILPRDIVGEGHR